MVVMGGAARGGGDGDGDGGVRAGSRGGDGGGLCRIPGRAVTVVVVMVTCGVIMVGVWDLEAVGGDGGGGDGVMYIRYPWKSGHYGSDGRIGGGDGDGDDDGVVLGSLEERFSPQGRRSVVTGCRQCTVW